MEGWNPYTGCSMGCTSCFRGWVPRARFFFPRRDALIDAVGKTDNPCERPARYPPCCKPVPKFRPPRELPECDINCYRTEERESKQREEYEAWMKAGCCCTPLTQCVEVESLDPNNCPLICNPQPETPPTHIFRLRDQKFRTNIIAGFFNPDDNKTREEQLQEQCNKYWRSCGPGLKRYPCRGTIRFPQQRWVSMAEEARDCCLPEVCNMTQYVTPEFMAEQEASRFAEAERERIKEKCACEAWELAEWEKEWGPCYPHPMTGKPGSTGTGRCG